MFSASFFTICKSSEIFMINIQEHIYKIMEEEEEAPPCKPADHETWRPHVKKAFADLFELPAAVAPASKHDFQIDTNPAAKPLIASCMRCQIGSSWGSKPRLPSYSPMARLLTATLNLRHQ